MAPAPDAAQIYAAKRTKPYRRYTYRQPSLPAESQIPIDPRLGIRGSYLSGFTYVCRRPKPFDEYLSGFTYVCRRPKPFDDPVSLDLGRRTEKRTCIVTMHRHYLISMLRIDGHSA